MGFKVASRVRGLSDEAFREACGTEEQCRTALVRFRTTRGGVQTRLCIIIKHNSTPTRAARSPPFPTGGRRMNL